ncbi:glycoside hydrolase family 43 protein [Croceicoccus marinus]|jgi:beta-xylosidase|nr:glycoside hydrolase 43 family protein [Croceicoccus marinus]
MSMMAPIAGFRLRIGSAVLGAMLALAAVPAATYAQPLPDPSASHPTAAESWTADNGDGSFTNPIFNDEFSDPDIIRVGDDYYMTGTTMHMMPGLPVLHSRDLVNWTLRSYAFDRLDLGPDWRLEDGQDIYGQGIWAPSLRFHDGMFHIFANVNGVGLQVFRSASPDGPWTRTPFEGDLHDVSVLFDDDGRVWAVYNYDEVRLVEIKPDLSGVIEGSERVIMPAGNALGEGHHFYKVDGRYYIITANYAPVGRMMAIRADSLDGPWETVQISARETMGEPLGWGVGNVGLGTELPAAGDPVALTPPPPADRFGASPLHQGGIVELPNGDWWGFSMMDVRSMGRTVYLSPVTWKDGWPFFGLPGNLGRSPRSWLKPATGHDDPPRPTWQRSDDFTGPELQPIWQWNHLPVGDAWTLQDGRLHLTALPASDFLRARNTLTQRAVAPESIAEVTIDGRDLGAGDRAGLALLNIPYGTLSIERGSDGWQIRHYDQQRNRSATAPLPGPVVRLRTRVDLDSELGQFSYSTDGGTGWHSIGEPLRLPYQLKTFQGVRFALFSYNGEGRTGGAAQFDDFAVTEPLADRSGNIPLSQAVTISNLADDSLLWADPHGMLHVAAAGSAEARDQRTRFKIHDRGQGRVAIEALGVPGPANFVTIVGEGMPADVRFQRESDASLFQWQDMLRGQFMLLSLGTQRYLGIDPATGEPYAADWPGPSPSRKDGTVFRWSQ